VIENGERPIDPFGSRVEASRTALAIAHDNGISVPAPPPGDFGVADAEQSAWLAANMTPHPFSTYLSQISLSTPPGADLPRIFIRCTDPLYTPLDWAEDRVRAYGWTIETIATGHDCMVSAPQATADLLERLAV